MSHTIRFAVMSIAASMIFLGCASNTSFRTAQPLGRGNSDAFVSVSNAGDDFSALVEAGATVGITDQFDVSLKYTLPASGGLHAKYTLIGADRPTGFYFAPGLGVVYSEFEITSGDDTYKYSRVDFSVPLYLTYAPTNWFALSAIPMFTGRTMIEGGDGFANVVGANANMRLGNRLGVIFEGGFHKNLTDETDEQHFGAGLFFEIENLLPFN
ncbi:hypothetical protein QA601_17920 [Chitinispirillales bacterium ANBcel5]|uniref:hypothetical protein n=1 Tax=Cellulosispirillum alkaliphilum TaxID=3039283 RepID=UPI002A5282E3|nr:hypothetical protein [Chitinispirillales bacterium ANBcel5]